MKVTISILTILCLTQTLHCKILTIGPGTGNARLDQVALKAEPGDTIIIKPGTYYAGGKEWGTGVNSKADNSNCVIFTGGEIIRGLQGKENAWIVLMAEKPGSVILSGGAEAIHLSDPAFVKIFGLVFEKQTANGVNIDDAASFETPASNLIIENCEWRGMDATGNNDELKMSGTDNFTIRNCRFTNGSKGGSLIDMVGCHYGLIESCHFENGGSNSVQVKGGSGKIVIQRNLFISGGERSVNIGGSTGLQYFRPAGEKCEASEIKVWSNIFKGSVAAVAFVGSCYCEVINNTIIRPEKWIIRILQENNSTGMKPCSDNIFRNNIAVFSASGKEAINIGPGTLPGTFTFSNNLWFDPVNKSWKGPSTPSTEINGIGGMDPGLKEEDYSPLPGSPAAGKGYSGREPVSDFYGKPFFSQRSIGAVEQQPGKK